jgi:serine/threonine protein kinase
MKAANLLINNKGQLQIADFGLARPFHDPGKAWEANGWQGGTASYTGIVVTRWYRPPEVLAGERRYGPAIDMWGLGCILGEMITRKPIFRGTTEINQLEEIAKLCGSPNEDSYPGWNNLPGVKNADPQGRAEAEPDLPGQHDFGNHPRQVVQFFTTGGISVRRELADLLDKMLVLDPCKRITAKEALEHEWFWMPPFPADPSALPIFEASKELDRQRRDQHRQQQQRMYQQQQQQMMKAGRPPPHHMGNHHHRNNGRHSNGHFNRPPPGYGPPINAMNHHAPPPSRPVPMGMSGSRHTSNYNQQQQYQQQQQSSRQAPNPYEDFY